MQKIVPKYNPVLRNVKNGVEKVDILKELKSFNYYNSNKQSTVKSIFETRRKQKQEFHELNKSLAIEKQFQTHDEQLSPIPFVSQVGEENELSSNGCC